MLKKRIKKLAPEEVPQKTIEPPRMLKGMPDPRFPGCILIPVARAPKHPFFMPLDPQYSFPAHSYYRYDRKEQVVRSLVTVARDGVRYAWDNCGRCASYFRACRCKNGLSVPRSVEFAWDWAEAKQKGEEFGISHPNYRGSLTRHLRERRDDDPYTIAVPARSIVENLPGRKPASGKQTPAVSEKPKKRIRTVAQREAEAAVAARDVDMAKVDTAAEELARRLTKKVLRKIPDSQATTAPGGGKRIRKLRK